MLRKRSLGSGVSISFFPLSEMVEDHRAQVKSMTIGVVMAGIGNFRFKVSQKLPRPPEDQAQITDLIS
jgi:hypothetical protein